MTKAEEKEREALEEVREYMRDWRERYVPDGLRTVAVNNLLKLVARLEEREKRSIRWVDRDRKAEGENPHSC